MEELSVLALLECPLCLEQLDVSAKVLPCQHTFCMSCLQRQEVAHSKLICPECRTPVSARTVEELPANPLLVRLLEGLQSPTGPSRGRQMAYTVPFFRSSFRLKEGQQLESLGTQRRERQGHSEVPVRAVHNHTRGYNLGDLLPEAANANTRVDENWHHGNAGDSSSISVSGGVQPGSSQTPQLQSQPPPLCRALCDFNPEEMNMEDCKYHSFFKGDVLTVIRRVDEHWIEVKLGDKVGLCPLQFTEPNAAAAKLLEGKSRKGSDSAEFHHRTSGGGKDKAADTSNRTSYYRVPQVPGKTTVINALSPSNHRKHPGTNNTHFYQTTKGETANISTFSNLNHQGHTHRLSGPPVNRGHSHHLKRHASSSHRRLSQSEKKMSSDAPPTVSMALVNPQMPSASTDSKNSSTQQLSISVCAVLYSYKPQRSEELELRKGEMVGVYGKFREGWLRGLSLRTGKVGILPGNYVTPVLRTSARLIENKAAAASSQYNTAAGKRPTTSRNPAVVLALDRVNPDGMIYSTGQGPSAPNGTQHAMSAPGTTLYGGTQGWDTVRRIFNPLKGSNQLSHATNLNAPSNSQHTHFAHVQASGYSPALQRKKGSGILSNLGRPLGRLSEPAAPSAAAVLMDLKHDRQHPNGPHSILIKPDSHKNNTEKPGKSVRFLTEEDSPPSTLRTSSWSSVNQVSSNSQPGPPPLEVWAPSLTLGRDGPGIILKEGKAPILRKGLEKMMPDLNSNLHKPPSSQPSLSAASAQFSPSRHRVSATHLAQTDSELSLLHGEHVLVHRPRPDGRVLVTQEGSGQTGIFHNSILQVLERLS
ncbi:E3 ubiquitin-protein ligase SH3RF2 [Genypterus blacodes]|uniref:E3 ubiquitin-protein ligase SH3RF2 n=1 Tax=Genypterus blacodes TaxID=154954 RepID=UPI003F76AFE3